MSEYTAATGDTRTEEELIKEVEEYVESLGGLGATTKEITIEIYGVNRINNHFCIAGTLWACAASARVHTAGLRWRYFNG